MGEVRAGRLFLEARGPACLSAKLPTAFFASHSQAASARAQPGLPEPGLRGALLGALEPRFGQHLRWAGGGCNLGGGEDLLSSVQCRGLR